MGQIFTRGVAVDGLAFIEAGEEAETIQWHRSSSYLRSAQALQGQGAGTASLLVFSDACVKKPLLFLFWVCCFKQCL